MLLLLAQAAGSQPATTSPATAPATSVAAPFDWSQWELSSRNVLHGATSLVTCLVIGFLILLIGRKLIARFKLLSAVLVGIAALTIFFTALGVKPKRMVDPNDPLAYWLIRIPAALLLYSFLRFMDRLAIIPILTRGGRLKLSRFIHQIVYILFCLFAILIFGSFAFDWDIDKFLAGSAVVSIVLGLALQETLGNFFSGMVMQASPPFAIGDWIVCGGHEGRVVDMTWRAVTIHTLDDNFVLIPNATVAKAEITNFHAPTIATARSLNVGLDYDVAPCDAIAVLKKATLESPGVLAKPEPFVYVHEFTDAAVLYRIKFWIDTPANYPKIEHAVRQNVWYRLHGRGFGIPFPTFNIEHISLEQKNKNLAAKSQAQRLEAIESVPLFAPLSEEQKNQLVDSTDIYLLSPGQVLFKQGEDGDSFYIVHKGEVHVIVHPEGGEEEKIVATLGPGNFFGEMSALTGQPRSATIRAATPISLVRVEKQDLHALFTRDPSLLEKISEVVAQRNAHRNEVLRNAGAAAVQEAVTQEKKSLVTRMISFFRLAPAA